MMRPRMRARQLGRTGTRLGVALAACLAALVVSAPTTVASVPAVVGFNDHAYDNSGSEDLPQSLWLAHMAGANTIRIDIGWNSFEPQPGTYYPPHVAALDAIINGAVNDGMKTLLMVNGTPCWASTDPLNIGGNCSLDPSSAPYWNYPPRNPSDYGNFVGWLTSRYGSELAGVEVWNEPNAPGDENFISSNPAADYAALVVAAHSHRTNGVPIVAGALWNGSRDTGGTGDLAFMDQLFAQPGFGASLDVFSTHSYGSGPAAIAAAVQARRDRLTADGSHAPIWVDEFGWSTCVFGDCVDQTLQGALLAGTFGALTQPSLGVTGAIAYDLRDDGISPVDQEQNWGVVTNNYLQKSGFSAVSTCLHGGSCGSTTVTAASSSTMTAGSGLSLGALRLSLGSRLHGSRAARRRAHKRRSRHLRRH